MTIFILAFITLITSSISGVIGMGGGVLLLSLMTFFLPYHLIIPIHGMTQLISNSSRAFMLRSHVKKEWMGLFVLGATVGAGLAVFWLKQVNLEHWPKLLIAILIFYTIFKPKKLPELKIPTWTWAFVGIIAGMLSILVGATGPFLAAFFVRKDLAKEEIVATKAMMQLFTHAFKIPAFIYLDFPYKDYALIMVSMGVCAVIGTKLGVKALQKINHEIFTYLFKFVLFCSGLRILYLIVVK